MAGLADGAGSFLVAARLPPPEEARTRVRGNTFKYVIGRPKSPVRLRHDIVSVAAPRSSPHRRYRIGVRQDEWSWRRARPTRARTSSLSQKSSASALPPLPWERIEVRARRRTAGIVVESRVVSISRYALTLTLSRKRERGLLRRAPRDAPASGCTTARFEDVGRAGAYQCLPMKITPATVSTCTGASCGRPLVEWGAATTTTPRRAGLRSGTHGGARVGRGYDYGPAPRKCVPTSAPHRGYRCSPARRGGGLDGQQSPVRLRPTPRWDQISVGPEGMYLRGPGME